MSECRRLGSRVNGPAKVDLYPAASCTAPRTTSADPLIIPTHCDSVLLEADAVLAPLPFHISCVRAHTHTHTRFLKVFRIPPMFLFVFDFQTIKLRNRYPYFGPTFHRVAEPADPPPCQSHRCCSPRQGVYDRIEIATETKIERLHFTTSVRFTCSQILPGTEATSIRSIDHVFISD